MTFLTGYDQTALKELKWFDIVIVTAILFGQFIIRSTQLFL